MEIIGFAAGAFQTNCYLAIAENGEASVIDPGVDAADQVANLAEERALTVTKVVLSHGHVDHARDAGAVADRFGVPVYLHPDDNFMLDDPAAGVSAQAAQLCGASKMQQVRDLRPLADEGTVEIGGEQMTVYHAPGHSPGCVVIAGKEAAFSGDVIFRGAIGRMDLPGSDPHAMFDSLERLMGVLPEELHLLPGHGPETVVSRERKFNPYMQGLGRR